MMYAVKSRVYLPGKDPKESDTMEHTGFRRYGDIAWATDLIYSAKLSCAAIGVQLDAWLVPVIVLEDM